MSLKGILQNRLWRRQFDFKGRRRLISPLPFFTQVVTTINILAIDQARNGAWSVFDYDTGEVVGYGTFSFDVKKYTYARAILHIEQILSAVIAAYDIKFVAIEDIQLRVNVQSFKKLAQLQGVIVNLCERNKLLYGLIAPTQWQNFCKARGRNTTEIKKQVLELEHTGKKESKILSLQFVKDQFGIVTDNDNLADACCLGYYAVNAIEIPEKNKRR